MFSIFELNELKNTFAVKVNSGTSLPEIKSVEDKTIYIVESDTIKLYIAYKGKWYLINTLTEV